MRVIKYCKNTTIFNLIKYILHSNCFNIHGNKIKLKLCQ